MGGFAWVTLATNDSYSLGALVLAHSLRNVGTKHDLAVLVTPGVTGAMREKLSSVFSLVQEVNVLDSKDEANLALLARPELGITFTKLHCWRLTQYEKCVFVDADALVIRNCDELFEREELSAAPDVGWPDCFNSGVFVFKPSQETFASLTSFAVAKGSFDGGDQGLLNQYFSDWAHKDISKHLPFIYNMCSTATYSYLPAFKQFGDDVRIIHFIGITKPWLQYFDTLSGQVQPAPGSHHLQPLLQLWWNIFCDNVHSELSPEMAGIAGALAKLTLGEARSAEQVAFEEHMRKQSWEQGQIDYMGRDSFDNIWKKITATLGTQPEREPSPPKSQPEPEKTEIKELTALPTVDQPTAKSEAAVPSEPQRNDEQDVIGELAHEVKKLVAPLSELTPEVSTESTISSLPSSLSDAAIEKTAKLSTLESFEAKAGHFSEPKTKDSTTTPAREIRGGKQEQHEDKGTVADRQRGLEVGAEGQVPIQVAESVLEADVKESVTEDLRPVTEEAISSISSIAQESVPAVLETAMEALDPIEPTPNGSANLFSGIGNGIDALSLSSPTRLASAAIAVVEQSLDIVPPVPTEISVTEDPTTKVDASSSMVAELVEEPKIITETETPPVETTKKADSTIPPEVKSSSTLLETAEKFETLPETPRALPTPTDSANILGGFEESEMSSTDLSPQVEIDQSSVEKTQDPFVELAQRDVSPALTVEVAPAPEISKTAPSSVSPPEEPKGIPPIIESCNLPTSGTVENVDSPSPPAAETKVPISCPAKPARKADELTKKMKKPTIPIDSPIVAAIAKDSAAEIKESEEISRAESRERSPVRPVRTKELEIPDTPTITEPTPPTSPPVDGAESLQEPTAKVTKKIVKKITKKTSETKLVEGAEPDTDGKKVTKKIVKKVVKKKEEDGNGSESTSGNDKPKKIVKVVKKTTKAPQTLDAEATVPETPPPGTSEVPVPPKRKLKTTTKTTSGKSDSES